MATVIAGFGSNDRVPGAFGEVVLGASGQSAASFPLLLLLVGLAGSGATITADTQVQQIFSKADADTYTVAGSEAACMAYDAFDTAASVPTFVLCPTGAGGVAASLTATVGGTWTASGWITLRIAGKPVQVNVGATDSTTVVAASIASAVKGAYQGRLPLTASPSVAVATLTCKTVGVRGNQHIVFADISQAPAGLTLALAGGTAVTGGGVPLSGGTLVETYTNALSTVLTSQFDRIALAANDTASAGVWKTQVDAQAAAPTNILQHVVLGSNAIYTTAATLAGSSNLNDGRFQVLWELNAETHPSRIAAAMASLRAATEQSDPCAAYNNTALPTVAPMSQKADWPSHSQLVTALNNGVTPVTSTGDGYARVVRSITTKSTTGGNPDYSTFDTSQASVPDFIFKDLRVYWVSVFAPANPRVQPDPAPGLRNPPTGVAYPRLWGAQIFAKLTDYSQGILSGNTSTVAPIILAPVTTDVIPNWDPVAKRIMVAVNNTPAYNNCQTGISVRQLAAA